MSFVEQDLLKRIIRDIARMLAAITGFRAAGKLEDAEAAMSNALAILLGGLARDAEVLDSRSVMRLLREHERVRWYATLLQERSKIRAAKGDAAGARKDELRALELLLELYDAEIDPEPELLAEVQALLLRVGPEALSKRYRELSGLN